MPERKTVEQLKAILDAPGPGQWHAYEHQAGGRYVVLCRSLREHDHEPLVTYASLDTGLVWTRPLAEFAEPKFTRVWP